MAGLIDVAYVEILPDLKKFDKQATKEIKASLEDAAKEADKSGEKIERSIKDSFKNGARAANIELNKVQRQIKEIDGNIHVKITIDDKEITRVFRRDLEGRLINERGRIASKAELSGLGIGEGIANGAKSALIDGLADVGKLVGGALSAAGPYIQTAAIGIAAALATTLGGALAPAIVALGASLPAAAAIGGAAIGTLILGFQGLGDALENMDDVDKFNKALEKLSPAARNFALELRGLQPILSSIKASAQEGLFRGFEGEITRVVVALQGPLRSGFDKVGQSIQGVVKQVTAFASSATGIDLINTVFGTTVNIIDRLAGAIGPLSNGLAKLTISATPFVEKLSGKFSDFLANIGTKLSALADNGSLEKFFNNAYDTLAKVWDISKNLFDVFKDLFSAAEPGGQSFLDLLKDITKDMAKFFDNETNVEALKTSFDLLVASLTLVGAAFKTTVGFLEDLDRLDQDIDKLIDDFGKFGDSVEKAFNDALKGTGDFFSGIGKWFSELPGEIGSFLSTIPDFVAKAFQNALAAALQAIGVGIGLIVYTFTQLPTQIGNALSSLGTTVTTFFINLWTSVSTWTMTKWDELVAWLSLLPGKIGDALSSLPGQLETFFVGLWTSVYDWAVNGWNSVIDWISGVPGRLADLATNFYNSGIDMIRGFFDGIANGAESGASSVGDAVYGAFKSAVNWAIDRINEGISSVNSVLPGAISTIPHLAKGGIAAGSMLANIGEAGDEAVLPLSGQRGRKTMEMLANAAGGNGNNVFESGAINITFDGVVPTRGQAFQTGEAVGMGITSILQKRDARTKIRMA